MKNTILIGLGHAGCNIVNAFEHSNDYKKLAVTSNTQQLEEIKNVDYKIMAGETITHGLGCGGVIDIGKNCMASAMDDFKNIVNNFQYKIIIACLGGGMGSGSLIELLDYLDKDYLIVATTPFEFEGERQQKQANIVLEKLKVKEKNVLFIDYQKYIDKLPTSKLSDVYAFMNNIIIQEITNVLNNLK